MADGPSALILMPRFTTLVGGGDFTSVPIDASSYGSAQLEIWRGPILMGASDWDGKIAIYLEESLDGVNWNPPSSVARGFDPGASTSMVISHIFALRWFRVRVKLTEQTGGNALLVATCWVEGMLR